MKKQKNPLFIFLKIGVTIALLYFVFSKIPLQEVWKTLQQIHVGYLLLGVIAFMASQFISVVRLQLLFETAVFPLSFVSNLKLYLLGMFYNFFIPGGIGGDAYKVYTLNKSFDWPVKKLSAAVLYDRILGLTAIGILVLCLLPFTGLQLHISWSIIIPICLILGLTFAIIFSKKIFPTYAATFWKGLSLSLIIQGLQGLCIIFLVLGLGLNDYLIYVLIFFVSAVLSLFSFAGIGVREWVFYQASILYNFNPDQAVTIGLLFTIISALISCLGIFFHLKKPIWKKV